MANPSWYQMPAPQQPSPQMANPRAGDIAVYNGAQWTGMGTAMGAGQAGLGQGIIPQIQNQSTTKSNMSAKVSTKKVNLTPDELKEFLVYTIQNNRHLQAKRKVPVAINIEGEAGLGKTSIALQLAQEMKMNYRKISLSQIEEIGDLVGYPHKEFEIVKQGTGEVKWVPETVLTTYIANKYVPTGEKRMTHAAPEWIQGLGEGGILILDDYTRADSRFMQAVMELIDRQEYISWKLPKDWHIFLTTNPDNGDYSVSSLDPAQKTRFITVNLKFDMDAWAVWAEKNEIDSRCINFLMIHPEVVKQETNPRSITTFFNSLSSITNFEERLPLIQQIGEGSVGMEFATLFTTFINNRLDKVISPDKILNSKVDMDVEKALLGAIGVNNAYRADIASVIATRVINYALYHAETKPVTKDVIQRIIFLCTESAAFTDDLKFMIVKKLIGGNRPKFDALTENPKLVKMAIK